MFCSIISDTVFLNDRRVKRNVTNFTGDRHHIIPLVGLKLLMMYLKCALPHFTQHTQSFFCILATELQSGIRFLEKAGYLTCSVSYVPIINFHLASPHTSEVTQSVSVA